MSKEAQIFHADVWGLRSAKYTRLASTDVRSTAWKQLKPLSDYFLFVPQLQTYAKEYLANLPLREIFRFDSVGVVTARDRLTVHFDRDALLRTVEDLRTLDTEDVRAKYDLGPDARDWKVELAQKDLRSHAIVDERVRRILYRPFDVRLTYYTGKSRGFIGQPQQKMANQMEPHVNIGLCTTRSLDIKSGWEHVFCAQLMIQHHAVSLKEVNYLFPLYLYPTKKGDGNGELFHQHQPNLTPEFLAEFSGRLKMEFAPAGTGDRVKTFGPEEVFHYMYAVFHSPAYRERYAEFLKIDFPRLPLTTDAGLFWELCARGAELTRLHVMEAHAPIFTRYPVAGDNTVEKPRYTEPGQGGAEGRVWINRTQYFDGVPPEVWAFRVGGYQVAEKWLKDRKGRPLTYDDLTHYQQTLAALRRTMELMAEVDEVIDAHGGWPLAGSVR
jgi:predicted helicase